MYYLYSQNERLAMELLIATYQHRRSMAKSERQVHNLWVDLTRAAYLMSLARNATFMVLFSPHLLCINLLVPGLLSHGEPKGESAFPCNNIAMVQHCRKGGWGACRCNLIVAETQTSDAQGWTWFPSILCKPGNNKWIIAVGWKECSHLYFSRRVLTIGEAIYYWKHYFLLHLWQRLN